MFFFLGLYSCQGKNEDLYLGIVKGNLTKLQNQEIRIEGFDGLGTYPIRSAIIDNKGNFDLTHTESDYGMGYLTTSNQKPFIVILSGEEIEITGELTKGIKLEFIFQNRKMNKKDFHL